MKERPKFAVVREDARVEERVSIHYGCKTILLVASAGCTALSLARVCPESEISLYDFNPRQYAALDQKIAAIKAPDAWTSGLIEALCEDGEFEGLFRVLRYFLEEFVFVEGEVEAFFAMPFDERQQSVTRWKSNPYWESAFRLAFEHGFLDAMFTAAATQHAAAGSYPIYFREVLEGGLRREDAAENPFLQHVFLGRYLCPPPWFGAWSPPPFERVLGGLREVPDLDRFDMIHLSNIFDWMDDDSVRSWCQALTEDTKPGVVVVNRQLNNQRDLMPFFGPAFVVNEALSTRLQADDRSLFYNRIVVAQKEGKS